MVVFEGKGMMVMAIGCFCGVDGEERGTATLRAGLYLPEPDLHDDYENVCSCLIHCLTRLGICLSCSMQGLRLCLDMHVLAFMLLPSSLNILYSHVLMHDCLTNAHSCLCASLHGTDRLDVTATQTGRKYSWEH